MVGSSIISKGLKKTFSIDISNNEVVEEAIRKLMALRPDVARVERDGEVVELPAEALRAGDILHLRPGERVAVDGEVIEGRSYIDESLVTGEPVPVEKSLGDSVTGGTINGSGALRFRATAVGRDTVLARIIAMVQDAQGAKLPIQALADKVVLWFVPAIIAIALSRRRPVAMPNRGLAGGGPVPRAQPCAGGGRVGADHRLPLRHGSGDAHVDHGRHRPGGRAGRPVSPG